MSKPHEQEFLRSINIALDAESPDRIGHFRPTSKSVLLLNALTGRQDDKAFFVIAPYGSGKSIAATYLLNLIENREPSRPMLRVVNKRMETVSPELAKFTDSRLRNGTRGMAIILQGYCRSLPLALKDAAVIAMQRVRLSRESKAIQAMPVEDSTDVLKMLASIRVKCEEAGLDQISILWDEFGKHLEYLVADGRPAALGDIQDLAEFVSRRTRTSVTLGLLLHRDLLQYAGNVSQSVRLEWTKIEGRFKEIQYVDDSKEIYGLIAEVIEGLRPQAPGPKITLARAARELKKLGLWADFTTDELTELLRKAYPLDPLALYLLPRISSRIAQNERTLFSFLYDVNLAAPVSAANLYDYFASQMRSDTSVGGTHRRWLETESALTKTGENPMDAKALKVACLLGLGLSGERVRASRDAVLLGVTGFEPNSQADKSLDRLIEKNLLLYRRHADELSVWHGTDIDLRARIDSEKLRLRESFEALQFLRKECAQPVWRPLEYNADFGVRRYLRSEFHTLATLQHWLGNLARNESDALPQDSDGLVCYIIPERPEELQQAEAIARAHKQHRWLLIVVPREFVPTTDAALEIYALNQLRADKDLVSRDPLVLAELLQMDDDARKHLQRCFDAFLSPRPNGARWFHKGRELPVDGFRSLRQNLSGIMREIYPKTPRIHNEMIVRRKPTASIVNLRKKLLMGILEQSGTPDLGLVGNFPDSAMFRTVLRKTGLYASDDRGRWKYQEPSSIADQGLAAVWGEIRDFFTLPCEEGRKVAEFLLKLKRPPYGVRDGLIPILLAAGLRAFPNAISLLRDDAYVPDILPSDVELLCKEPERHRLVVLKLDEPKRQYLAKFLSVFLGRNTPVVAEQDMIRKCYDALEGWRFQLPKAAFQARHVSEETKLFRSLLTKQYEPIKLLFEDIPKACGARIGESAKIGRYLQKCKDELEGVTERFANQASAAIESAVRLNTSSTLELRAVVAKWANCFAKEICDKLPDSAAKALLFRIKTGYETDRQLIDAVAALVAGTACSDWDDTTSFRFERDLTELVRKIEEFALSEGHDFGDDKATVGGLASLAEGRVLTLMNQLRKIAGSTTANDVLQRVVHQLEKGQKHGNT